MSANSICTAPGSLPDAATLRERIRALVETDELREAACLLADWARARRRGCNEVSLLKRRLHALERRERTGLLDFREVEAERTRVGWAILEMVEAG